LGLFAHGVAPEKSVGCEAISWDSLDR
jgi:hypothetical protein